jgi:predicted RND superfamily exporter protein
MKKCMESEDIEQQLVEKDPEGKRPGSKPMKKMKSTMAFIRTSIKFYSILIGIVTLTTIALVVITTQMQDQEMMIEQLGMVFAVIVEVILFALLYTFKEFWPINIFILYLNIWLCGIVFGIGIFSYMRIILGKIYEE